MAESCLYPLTLYQFEEYEPDRAERLYLQLQNLFVYPQGILQQQ